MGLSQKAINFDLDTNALKEYYPKKDYHQAYDDIKKFMTKNGFEHRQGSGYVSSDKLSNKDILKLTEKIVNNMPWISKSVNKFDATNIGKVYDLTKYIKEPYIDISKEKNMQQNNAIKLTITSTENLRPELQNLFKKDVEINKNDEVSLLLKTLEHIDKIIELKNNQEMKFPNPNEKIGLNLKTDNGKNFDLNIPMGSGNFSKGLGHLIAIGNQDLKRDTFNKDDEKKYVDIIEKTGKGHEQKSSEEDLQKTNSFFDKVFNGGLQSLEAAASIGGEEIKDFTNSFIKGFKILDIKTEPKTFTPKKPDINKAMANDLKMIDAKSKEAFEKMRPQKEREKEITNHKSLGISK